MLRTLCIKNILKLIKIKLKRKYFVIETNNNIKHELIFVEGRKDHSTVKTIILNKSELTSNLMNEWKSNQLKKETKLN